MNTSAGFPIPIGVVGSGGVAQVIHLPILKSLPDVKLAAICDVDLRKATVIADKFGIPGIYGDVEEMLDREQLEAIFVLTPNNLHYPVALIGLERRVHIFLEKPATLSSEEARKLRDRAHEQGVVVMVGMQNRFRPDVRALQTLLTSEDLGEVFLIKGGWLQAKRQVLKQPWLFKKNISGGGVLMDLGVQLLDLAWWLAGKPQPKSVKGFSYHLNKDLEVEDFLACFVNFENNVAVSLEMSWDFPIEKDRFYLEVTSENGIGTLNPLKVQKYFHGQMLNITPSLSQNKMAQFKRGYENEIHHFINFLTGRVSELESTIDEAVTVMQIVEMVYQSVASE